MQKQSQARFDPLMRLESIVNCLWSPSSLALGNIPADAAKIRQPISIDDDYNGHTITVTAFDAETNATLSVLRLNFESE